MVSCCECDTVRSSARRSRVACLFSRAGKEMSLFLTTTRKPSSSLDLHDNNPALSTKQNDMKSRF